MVNCKVIRQAWATPWKIRNELFRWLNYPWFRLLFTINDIPWGEGWRFHGAPIIQKHRNSIITLGPSLCLRSSARSNPLAPNHPVFITTWQKGARVKIGANFAMTGGSICAVDSITIGDNVTVGANTTIADTDFHSLDSNTRFAESSGGKSAPIIIEDDVFIGTNCLILKGVTIGRGSVVGAGSVVTGNVPARVIVSGNPAKVMRELKPQGGTSIRDLRAPAGR